ncbi:MAG: hypothetical protein WCS15_04545 [Prevotella sp.]
MDEFVFNGKSSKEYGVVIETANVFSSPKKSFTVQTVPGRNGDVCISNNRYENVTISYDVHIRKNFQQNLSGLISWIGSAEDYARLEDSVRPDFFRLAFCELNNTVKLLRMYSAGSFTIKFDCKPQLFLKSGESEITITADRTIYNPTQEPSKPMMRVYGNGQIEIGVHTLVVSGNENNYIDIDCDAQDAYRNSENCNSLIALASDSFPTLASGKNGIVLGTGISKLQLTPRWWTL